MVPAEVGYSTTHMFPGDYTAIINRKLSRMVNTGWRITRLSKEFEGKFRGQTPAAYHGSTRIHSTYLKSRWSPASNFL